MGQLETATSLKSIQTLTKQSFNFQEQIGSGGFSTVYKAYYPKVFHALAIKEMSKKEIINRNLKELIINERNILSNLFHPFIVNMYATFQNEQNLYLVMDYCPYGDLRYQMKFIKNYPEAQIRFITGCIILGLEYIHSKGIIHRDIKPENIICDDKGFYRISDFSISTSADKEISNYFDLIGSPGYISPEAIKKEKIGYENDYFSLGVLLYELIFDKLPFNGTNKKDIIEEFNTSSKINITPNDCKYSHELCDFINGLLELDNNKRLGKGGISELKFHSFFLDFNWKSLCHKIIQPPMMPRPFYKQKTKLKYSLGNKGNITYNKNTIETYNVSQENKYSNIFKDYNFIRKPEQNYLMQFCTNKLNNERKKISRSLSLILSPSHNNNKHFSPNTTLKSPKIKLLSRASSINNMNSFANHFPQKHKSSNYLLKSSEQLPSIQNFNLFAKTKQRFLKGKINNMKKILLLKQIKIGAKDNEEKKSNYIMDVYKNIKISNKRKNHPFNNYMNLQNNTKTRISMHHIEDRNSFSNLVSE